MHENYRAKPFYTIKWAKTARLIICSVVEEWWGNPMSCWWECKLVQPLWKSMFSYRIWPSQADSCLKKLSRACAAALFLVAPNWKQDKSSSIVGWMNCGVCDSVQEETPHSCENEWTLLGECGASWGWNTGWHPSPLAPGGLCVIFLEHSWLPKVVSGY